MNLTNSMDQYLRVKSQICEQLLCNALIFDCVFSRLATNANTVETILHGSVGLLTARSGGHLVTLQCYVSPYDIFEEGPGTQLNLQDGNSKYIDKVD